MKKTRVLFSQALLLNPNRVLNLFKDVSGMDLSGWKTYCHHMTIEFYKKGTAQSLRPLESLMGSGTVLNIVGYAADDKAVALLVEPSRRIAHLVKNANPHITIATAQGVKPSYSNELLETAEIIPLKGRARAAISWRNPKGEDVLDLPWEFSVPMPSYDYTEGVSGAGSWNSTPQRVRAYAKELIEGGYLNPQVAQSAWKNTDKLEALIRAVNIKLP